MNKKGIISSAVIIITLVAVLVFAGVLIINSENVTGEISYGVMEQTPTMTPVSGILYECPNLNKKVPNAVIADALANPGNIWAYNKGRNPYMPVGINNPPRLSLTIHRDNLPYHYLWNSVEYKAGCP